MRFFYRFTFFMISMACSTVVRAQNQVPGIHGWVTDMISGERLENAIVIDSVDLQYTYANRDGYYNMGVSTGRHVFIFTAAGYRTIRVAEDVYRAREITVELEPMGEYETDTLWNLYHAVFDLRSGHTSPGRKQIEKMPALLTIADPVKFLQFLPGVTGGIEGLSGMYVRGGNSDQNLMMMDGLPLYGNGHLFGFLSPYNAELLGNVEFYRGVTPARYGGRAGAVMDVSMKEGARNKWSGVYNHDLLLMNVSLDGPLNSSGTVTGSFGMRRSWLDLLLPKDEEALTFYNLHDLNAKVVARIGKSDKLSFFVYNGRDKARVKAENTTTDSLGREIYSRFDIGFNWQNTLAGITWSHKFNTRHYGTFMAGMTRATYRLPLELAQRITTDTSNSQFEIKVDANNAVTDGVLRADLEYRLAGNAHLHYGGEVIYHRFSPGLERIRLFTSSSGRRFDTTFGEINVQSAIESSVYTEYEKNLGAGLKLNAGLRLWSFAGRNKTWIRPEPRILISQILQGQKALKLGFSMANQGMHRLSSVNGNLPGDVWFPTTGNFRPQRTMQITGGYYQPWRRGWEFSIDLYYRTFDGITDLTGLDEGDLDENYWEALLSQGKGTAYGAEMMLIRKVGRLTGLLSYTLSRSNRKFDDLNFGEMFPFRWDRRHKLALQGVYKVNDVYTLNFAAVVMSGNAVTVPTGSYLAADGSLVFDYSARNNYRMPVYKRIDLGFTKKIKPYLKRDFESYWGVNIYNLASWKNPLFVRVDSIAGTGAQATGISYFTFIPSAIYRVKF